MDKPTEVIEMAVKLNAIINFLKMKGSPQEAITELEEILNDHLASNGLTYETLFE